MNSEIKLQSVSQWLEECGSHEIYPYDSISNDFETRTGQPFPRYIHTYTFKETQQVMQARGLGGTLQRTGDKVVGGYVMAADFARHLVRFTSIAQGRGRIFHDSIAALKEAGL